MDRKPADKKMEDQTLDERPEDVTTQADLDEALADPFPASDPPAPVIKGTTRHSNPKERDKREERERKRLEGAD
jgi:hypothetical protein